MEAVKQSSFLQSSRIFRPWDEKCEQNSTVSHSKFSEIAKEGNVTCYRTDLVLPCPLDTTLYKNYHHLDTIPIGDYTVNCGMLACPSFDVSSLNFVEQEYSRVIFEDAQMKAVNARKQRPKRFKCPHCSVAFSNNGQLKGHIRIHTGERPFKCVEPNCGKTFTRNEELTRHKRIHTGLRPFGCSICGKKFGRRDHLKKHLKTHMSNEINIYSALFLPIYPFL